MILTHACSQLPWWIARRARSGSAGWRRSRAKPRRFTLPFRVRLVAGGKPRVTPKGLHEGSPRRSPSGDPALLRAALGRKPKTDARDAWPIFPWRREGRFPRIWIPSPPEREGRPLGLCHSQMFASAIRLDPLTPGHLSPKGARGESVRIHAPLPLRGEGGVARRVRGCLLSAIRGRL